MRIGFLYWGSPESESRMPAYFHRIHVLRKYAESRGHETMAAFTADYDGRGKLAMFCNKGELRKFLDSCDAVYLGHTDSAAYAAEARPSGEGLLYDSHGPQIGERVMMFKANPSLRELYFLWRSKRHEDFASNRCKAISTVSTPSLKYYANVYRRRQEELFLVRNHFNPAQYPLTEMPAFDERRFAYVGGMDRWQGVDDLIEGYSLTSKELKLSIVGFHPQHNKVFMERAKAAGIDAHPRMPRPEALQFLARSHFGVTATPKICADHMPGAFPTKWAEYLGMGRSVMITRAYECAEITERENFGVVCSSGPKGIAGGLERAAALSPEQIKDQSSRGREWVLANCSEEVVGEAFLRAVEAATCR